MEETRATKYGRFLAKMLNQFMHAIPTEYRWEYKTKFIQELKNYSFETRRKGSPINSGCVKELEQFGEYEHKNPELTARIIKEGIHLMYQKSTAKRVLESLLENF